VGGNCIHLAFRPAEVTIVVIKFNFSSLKNVKWHEYAIRFALGGVITVATGLIAKVFGPVTGGLFLALPAIFPASATLLEKHERDKKRRAGIAFTLRGRLAAALDARGAAMGGIALFAFAGVAWRFLPDANVALVLGLALVVWLFVATSLWYIRRHHPWSPARTHSR
jgi:Protein of unknown function (DUF3147)